MLIQEAFKLSNKIRRPDKEPVNWAPDYYITVDKYIASGDHYIVDSEGQGYEFTREDLLADDWEVYRVKKEDRLIAERYVITLDGRTVGCRSNRKSVESEPGFRDIYIPISQEDLSRLGYVPKPIWRNCKTDPPGKKDDVRRLVIRNAHNRTNLLIGQYFPYKGSWGHHLPMYFHANPERFEWTEIPE